MSHPSVRWSRFLGRGVLVAALAAGAALPALAQAAPAAGPLKIAVIDSDRIVAESTRGKAALEKLKKAQEDKLAQGRQMQQELNDLRKRLDDGQLSLAPEKLADLKKQYEDKAIAFKRFQDDADRDLGKLRDDALDGIEKDVLEIIDQIGKEQGYTLIFNKFRSGLVFASDAIDITDQVVQRFNAAGGAAAPGK